MIQFEGVRRRNTDKLLHHIFSLFSVVLRIRVFLALFVLITLVGCGSTTGTTSTAEQTSGSSAPWPGSLAVTFAPSISYEKALRLVTEIGLQPALDCRIAIQMNTGKAVVPQQLWEPVGQKDSYFPQRQLLVDTATPPSDWWNRLTTSPGVSRVGFLNPSKYRCKAVTYGTPSAKTPVPLTARVEEQYSRITFNVQENYDEVLYIISNEGLHLADPCYDQAKLQGKKPSWHLMEQEKAFTSTHTLLVATSKGVSSNLWLEHLKALPTIHSINKNVECIN